MSEVQPATPPPASEPPASELPEEALRTGALAPLVAGAIVAGRYRLDAQLGAGGFGAVWKARNLDLDRDVALKLLHPELARDPALQKRFLREVDVATRFVHRYAVQVRDAGRDPARGLLYLTMDLVSGQTLSEALKAGPLAPERAARLTAQALEALGEAHRAGLVHRDIKPANLMLCQGPGGEEVRVLDFGIARAFDRAGAGGDEGGALHTLTAAGAVIGTVAYMSPEQAQGLALDARSDLYSLGVTLYQALSGRFPHEPDPQASSGARSLLFRIVSEPPRDLAQVAPAVPAALRAVVMRALAKAPDARWPDAAGFAAALRAAAQVSEAIGEAPTVTPVGALTAVGAAATGAVPAATTAARTPPASEAKPEPPQSPPHTAGTADTAGGPTSTGAAGGALARGLMRALLVAIGAAPLGGLTGAVMVLGGIALGMGGGVEELLPVAGVAALVGAALGALTVGLEELATRTRRPGAMFLGLIGALWLLLITVTGLAVAAGEISGGDFRVVALLALLGAVPYGVIGLARCPIWGAQTGAQPGGAPLGGGARLLLTLGAGGLIAALGTGPLARPLETTIRDPAERAGAVFLIVCMALGASLALSGGDRLARRAGLDPRPAPVRARPLLGLAAALLTLLVIGGLALFGLGLERGIDLRRPRIEIYAPATEGELPDGRCELAGRIVDGNPARLLVEPVAWDETTRVEAQLGADGRFVVPLALQPGYNLIRLLAEDAVGNRSERTVTLTVAQGARAEKGGY